MLVMRTTKDPANPLCEFISSQKTIGLDHFPLAVNPFRLYRVQPRTLLGQQAADNPHSISALFDLAVVPGQANASPHGLCASSRCPRSEAEPSCQELRAFRNSTQGIGSLLH